jgi:hypothetical protein
MAERDIMDEVKGTFYFSRTTRCDRQPLDREKLNVPFTGPLALIVR